MELILNLAWVALIALMFWLWLRHTVPEDTNRWTQFVALIIVIFILLPAISVTDDLMMAQNSAETEYFQRKSQFREIARPTHYPTAVPAPPLAVQPFADISWGSALVNLIVPVLKVPVMSSIQNRPPPPLDPSFVSASSAG